MNDRNRRPFRLAFGLALVSLPAPAVLAYTAHYFVVTENSSTGELAVAHHQLVELAGSPEGSATRPRRSALESRLQARVLDKASGDARFETMVTGSPWVRGEFTGTGAVDARIVPVAERQYVVRVPVGSSAMLELQGLDSDAGSASPPASGQGPRYVVDLDEANTITGPIKAVQKALPTGSVTGTVSIRPDAKVEVEPCSSFMFQKNERQ